MSEDIQAAPGEVHVVRNSGPPVTQSELKSGLSLSQKLKITDLANSFAAASGRILSQNNLANSQNL